MRVQARSGAGGASILEVPGSPIGPSRHEHLIVLLLSFVPCAVKFLRYPGYPGSDDSFIHLTIVRNLIDNHVWGVQAGSAVNLSSSPLFTLILWVIGGMGGRGLIPAATISMISAFVALILLHRITLRLSDSPGLRVAAVCLGAFNLHLWRWTGTAMETTLACCAMGATLLTYYRFKGNAEVTARRWFMLGILVGMATLVRFELGLLLPVLATSELLHGRTARSRILTFAGGALTILVAWCLFAFLYFGSILPTTYNAKAGILRIWNPKVLVQVGAVVAAGAGVPLLLSFAALSASAFKGTRGQLTDLIRRGSVLMGFPLTLLMFYYLKTDGLQSAGRYCLPGLYVMPLLCLVVAERAKGHATFRTGKYLLIVAVAAQIAITLFLNETRVRPVLTGFESNYWAAMRLAAAELKSVCGSGQTVLVEADIGVISYEGAGACRIADGGGLASPDLRGLSISEKLLASRADFVLESLGDIPGHLTLQEPSLKLLEAWPFRSHSVESPRRTYFCSLYRVTPR